MSLRVVVAQPKIVRVVVAQPKIVVNVRVEDGKAMPVKCPSCQQYFEVTVYEDKEG